MRKICLLLFLILLLTGCDGAQPQATEPSTLSTVPAATQPTTEPTTAPTTAPTETTEAPLPEFTPSLWLLEPEYVSYEEYFSSEHSFSKSSGMGWLVLDGDKGIRYWVDSLDYAIHSSVREDVFQIPNSEQLQDYGSIHADGKYAWLRSKTQIAMLHMATGEILQQEQLSRSSPLGGVLTDNTVYYTADHSDGQFHIYRIYLPELKVDHLHSFAAPETFFRPNWSASVTKENSIVWTAVNPKILAALEKAIQDPGSPLRYGGGEKLWASKYPYTDVEPETLKHAIYHFQNALDEPAYVHYIYNYAEGTLTTQDGIICHCEYGTGEPHDHGDPVVYEIAQPILAKEEWMPIPGMELQALLQEEQGPEDPWAYRFISFVNIPEKLPYLVENEIYTPLNTAGAKNNNLYIFDMYHNGGQGVFYVTKDNRVLQLSYDGSVCNTLYVSDEEITDVAYLDGYFYVLEGKKILQLNIEKGEYRVLIYQEHCKKLETVFMPGGRYLYIRATKGLSSTDYVYNPSKDAIEPWYGEAV